MPQSLSAVYIHPVLTAGRCCATNPRATYFGGISKQLDWHWRDRFRCTERKSYPPSRLMNLTLRPGKPDDAKACGQICFDAFTTISNHHNFPPDVASVEMATGFLTMLLSRPDIYSIVAEADGKVVGSNFLWEGDTIAGIGPITIDPDNQNSGWDED